MMTAIQRSNPNIHSRSADEVAKPASRAGGPETRLKKSKFAAT
jgi:hypothetical protein